MTPPSYYTFISLKTITEREHRHEHIVHIQVTSCVSSVQTITVVLEGIHVHSLLQTISSYRYENKITKRGNYHVVVVARIVKLVFISWKKKIFSFFKKRVDPFPLIHVYDKEEHSHNNLFQLFRSFFFFFVFCLLHYILYFGHTRAP